MTQETKVMNKTLSIFKNLLSDKFLNWCYKVKKIHSNIAKKELVSEVLEPKKSKILSNEYYFYSEYFEEITLDLKNILLYFRGDSVRADYLKNKTDVENLINHLVNIKLNNFQVYNVYEDKEYEIKAKFYIEENTDE